MKLWIVLLMLFTCLTQHISYADELTTEKRSDIKILIKITGADKLGIQMGQQVSNLLWESIKSSNRNIPEKLILIVQNEIMSVFKENIDTPGGLIDMTIPIFAKHLTHKEIKELSNFYQSQLGQKMIKIQPLLLSESMALGNEFGQKLTPEIDRRIKAAFEKEGFEIPDNFSFF